MKSKKLSIKKIAIIIVTFFFLSFCLTSCRIKDLIKDKIVNERKNTYIEYEKNITVENIEDALVVASQIGMQCSVGIKMESNGFITSSVGTGSGVITKREELENGSYRYYVITNRHVIYAKSGAKRVQVYLGSGKGFFDATIITYDSKVDLAVLSFTTNYLLNVATIKTDIPKIGSYAIAIGSPYDLEAYFNTVTIGSISASLRYYKEDDANGKKVTNEYIQHCAPINSGNSGGGLFNIYGELIGINTWKVVGDLDDSIEGLCFSVPSRIIVDKYAKYVSID